MSVKRHDSATKITLDERRFSPQWTILGGRAIAVLILEIFASNSHSQTVRASAADTRHILARYNRVPLSFEINKGQADSSVRYVAHGIGYGLYLAAQDADIVVAQPQNVASGVLHSSPMYAPMRVKNPASSSSSSDKAKTSALNGGADFDRISMHLEGSNDQSSAYGIEELAAKVNYFIGNNPAMWHRDVPTFAKVRFSAIYPGIDLEYHGNGRELEYDFILAPGARPGLIRMHFSGAKQLRLDSSGNVVIEGTYGDIVLKKPCIYQLQGRLRKEVEGRFVVSAGNTIGFSVSHYEHSKALVIDPVLATAPILAYSTYLGGETEDLGTGVAVDESGSAYVTGYTYSSDFPVTAKAIQTKEEECCNDPAVFVTKFSADGKTLIYSTYIAGTVGDYGAGIAVDSSGNAYVTGHTWSPDFPVTSSAFQSEFHGNSSNAPNAFVCKLNSSGNELLYSSYLGGTGNAGNGDYGEGIAVDSSGNAYITGYAYSVDFPITSAAYQGDNKAAAAGGSSAFVTKVNPSGSKLVYSTYLGGSGTNSLKSGNLGPGDLGEALAIDKNGNVFIAGISGSTDFPTTSGVVQNINNTTKGSAVCYNAFITKLDAEGATLLYSTYLGGSGTSSGFIFGTNYCDGAYSIRIDSAGNAYIAGDTGSSNFPVTKGAFQTKNGEIGSDYTTVFVAKLNSRATSLIYATYLGGTKAKDIGTALAVDALGDVYVAGATYGSDFPTTLEAFQTGSPNRGSNNPSAFLSKLNPMGSSLLYSTYLAGSNDDEGTALALDRLGDAFLAGSTDSTDFPVTKDAFQRTKKASQDTVFLTKFMLGGTNPTISSISPVSPDELELQSITIYGEGFGSKMAYSGDSAYLKISDITQEWNAGSVRDPNNDSITLQVKSWSDSVIQITGFGADYGGQNSLVPGDKLLFQVWNAETGQGPAEYQTTVLKAGATGRVTLDGAPMPFVPVLHLGNNKGPSPFTRKETAVADAQGYYFFSQPILSGEYIVPASSGGYKESGDPNQGPHGYLFSPNFCQAGVLPNSPRVCPMRDGAIIFTASTKPAPLSPSLNFRMPLPAGCWMVTTEAGGYALTGGSVDADPSHTDLNEGFWAIDIAGPPGTPVLAAADGIVVSTQNPSESGGFGYTVVLMHDKNVFTRYAHLESISVRQNESVKQGDEVGLLGETGTGTGPHVHFQFYDGGFTPSYSLSKDQVLPHVRIEIEGSSLPITWLVAGQGYSSTNVGKTSIIPCKK